MERRLVVTLAISLIVGLLAVLYSPSGLMPASAAPNAKPFTLPFNTPPGPGTWLLGQQFGNTQGAFNNGRYWYAAGQGLHFGIDFSAPCGTPVVAIGDGVIDQVDNFSFGLEPHNLTIFHRDLGLTSLYGHLYTKPTVTKGQLVKRGDVIAYTGDPDRTCVSRPHLHLEVRSRDYRIAHNPADYIDADWTMLSSVGSYSSGVFAKDLYHPNRWQTIFDQPDVAFNQAVLNNFRAVWPPAGRVASPPQTLPAYTAPAIAGVPTFKQLTQPDCCSLAWWSPDSRSVRFWNGPDGQLAAIMEMSIDGGQPQQIDSSPVVSPDGQYEVHWDSGRVTVIRVADKQSWALVTGSAWPRPSPGGKRLLWRYAPADTVPGTNPPKTDVWTSNLDGSGLSLVITQRGGSAYWLDDDRILLVRRQEQTNVAVLSVFSISTRQNQMLLTATNLRDLSISPGGQYLMYYLAFQKDPAASGTYLLETRPGATASRLPFFGGWRWRDSRSVVYIPFAPGKPMSFALYDVPTGQSHPITDAAAQPLAILNGDWSVSPDGQHVVFWNVKDLSLWVVTF